MGGKIKQVLSANQVLCLALKTILALIIAPQKINNNNNKKLCTAKGEKNIHTPENCPFLVVSFDTHVVLLQEMIDEADRDGDGEINEAEFLRIMKKTSLY